MQPRPVPRRSVLRRRVIPGAAVVLALMAGVEVVSRFLAENYPNPNIRVVALAVALGVGAVVAALRNGGAPVVLLAASLAGGSSWAGDRSRQYNVTVSTSACPTGAPGLLYDLKEPGIALFGLRAWNPTVCPAAGQTFTGVGGWRACIFRRSPGPNQWVTSNLYLDMADDGTGNPIVTTVANPCRTFWDVELGVDDGDLLYLYPTTTIGISGGTAVSVYLKGALRVP